MRCNNYLEFCMLCVNISVMARGLQFVISLIYAFVLSVIPLAHAFNVPMHGSSSTADSAKGASVAAHCGAHATGDQLDDTPVSQDEGSLPGCKSCKASTCSSVVEAKPPVSLAVWFAPKYSSLKDQTLSGHPPESLIEPPRA